METQDSASLNVERRQASAGPIKKLRIGEWLQSLGLISQFQLSEALTVQMETGKRIGDILISKGYISEKELTEVLTLQEVLSTKSSLTDFPIDKSVLGLVPENFARQNLAIPLVKVGRRLVMAVTRVDDTKILDHVSLLTGYFVLPIPFRREDLQSALSYFYENRQLVSNSAIERAIKSSGFEEQNIARRQIQELGISTGETGEAPIIELVNNILSESVDIGVSDIHLEPREHCLEVRFRIDGVLSKYLEIPKSIENSVLTRFKVLSNMNITEKRRPQDGRFTASFKGEKLEFRVSCIATHFGEKLALRLLRHKSILLGIENLGFEPEHLALMERIVHTPTGIILATGPTGSGKTTTLYAALQKLDHIRDSIITIEDPVEYPIEGISQIQVNTKIDLTFASALRTVLRLDPDVIMVGEIRDFETLDTAANAAMTGHLVFSTIHTNDSASTISRMVEMGVPAYVVSSTLAAVISQRLVRRVCSRCLEEYEAPAGEKRFLGVAQDQPLTLVRGRGCDHCNQTGYRGQVGVYEILVMNRQLQSLIEKGATTMQIADAAREQGFKSMIQDAQRKILKRMTSVEEVVRILGYGGL